MNAYPEVEQVAIRRLLETLIDTINKWDQTTTYSPFYDNDSKVLPEVRSIGKSLNDMGGYDLMLLGCKAMPRSHQRELEFAWSGIGQWRA